MNSSGYQGEFINGQFNGNCKIIRRNGDTFVGTFKFGKPSGEGILNYSNGVSVIAEFHDGLLQNDKVTRISKPVEKAEIDLTKSLIKSKSRVNLSTRSSIFDLKYDEAFSF